MTSVGAIHHRLLCKKACKLQVLCTACTFTESEGCFWQRLWLVENRLVLWLITRKSKRQAGLLFMSETVEAHAGVTWPWADGDVLILKTTFLFLRPRYAFTTCLRGWWEAHGLSCWRSLAIFLSPPVWLTLHQLARPWSLKGVPLRMLEENASKRVTLRAQRQRNEVGQDGMNRRAKVE